MVLAQRQKFLVGDVQYCVEVDVQEASPEPVYSPPHLCREAGAPNAMKYSSYSPPVEGVVPVLKHKASDFLSKAAQALLLSQKDNQNTRSA